MNFFEHQAKARSQTGLLVFLYILAVGAIVFSIDAVVLNLARIASDRPLAHADETALMGLSTLGTLLVILLGTIYRVVQLSAGGHAVAQMLGARLLDMDSKQADERRLINVVEEMAIASGIPVPGIYVMEENHINAFAAGFKPQDAVVAVTRRTIEKLTRDELQGVVAHEFSHIFNGDMKLNLRLMGVLNGILFIGLIGRGTLRLLAESHHHDDDKDSKVTVLAFVVGIALTIIGFAGVFFGRLIQAAVSRQREYLADASAVQFTRNPKGIGGALKKILAETEGPLAGKNVEFVSHMFFTSAMTSLFATHPPLVDRIKAIDADWEELPPERKATTPEAAVKSVGRVSEKQLAYAVGILDEIEKSEVPVRTPEGAQAAVLSVLDGTSPVERKAQFPLVCLALPHLRRLGAEEKKSFLEKMDALIHADGRVTPFEAAVEAAVKHALAPARERVIFYTLKPLAEECSYALSVLSSGPEAFARGAARLPDVKGLGFVDAAGDRYRKLSHSLTKLSGVSPSQKRLLLEACVECALHDEQISDDETELLRVVSEVLGCPLPPLV